jgi:sec-independent protein translocase protein TatA
MIGYQEMIIIFLIVLLLFGGKKIPEIARGLGKGLREFRKARDDIKDSIDREAKGDEEKERGEEDNAENDDSKEA